MTVALKETFYAKIYTPSPVGEVELYFASGVPEHTRKKKGLDTVSIHPEDAQFPISGLINPSEQILKIIDKAEENEIPLLLRFEQKRKSNQPLDTPIVDLKATPESAKENTVKLCVGVYDYNNNKWILSSEANSDPANDPAIVKNVINSAKLVEVDEQKFFEKSKPYVPLTDQFHKQQQLITMYFFVKEQENKHNYELTENDRLQIAKAVLKTADAIQKFITKVDFVNYNGYEHTRSRAMVFNFTEHFYPLTEDSTNNIREWQAKVWKSATALLANTVD